MTASNDDLSFADEALDPFAPARVDDTIAAALLDPDGAQGSSEGRLVLALAAGHALPAHADAAIERVRARLAEAPLTPATLAEADDVSVTPHPVHNTAPRPITRAQSTLRALAAVLVVALLAGGFVALLHGRQGSVTPTPRWANVSITHARTTQPLDFDLANGISYAAAQTGGVIYACSGKSLWYSYDGGVSYAPFTPAPPDGTMDGMCTLDTVPGLPGVFVRNLLPDAERISYGEPGGAWRTLELPDAVPAIAVDPRGNGPLLGVLQGVSHQDIGSSFFFPGPLGDHLVQYTGQWLIVLVNQPLATHQPGFPSRALIATRDFGQTWVWLDATLFSQSQQECISFVVLPSSSSSLGCLTENPNTQPIVTGLAFTSDFGMTWRLGSGNGMPLAIVGANSQSIFYVRSGPQATAQLVRYDVAMGTASELAILPDWVTQQPFGTPPPLALMPNGTVYQAYVRGDTGAATVGLDAVLDTATPSGTPATQIAPAVTLRAKGLTPTLAFGDLDGTAPALYLGVGNSMNKGDISPLYRLALPAPRTAPPHWTAVIDTPTVPSPPSPSLPSACARDPVTTAAIRPGGLGALGSTFAARWGGADGVALGTTYFGRYGDTGMPIVGVPSTALGPNARVPNLTYHVDSTAHITLAQARGIAATILPTDVHAVPNGFGTPPPTAKPIAETYCSAAFWAAFPAGTPSFTHGELAVAYNLRADGSVDSIDFSPAIIG